jgi:hypothetical protein
MKMFYLVDTCGKELADCLDKATADFKVIPNFSVPSFTLLNGNYG